MAQYTEYFSEYLDTHSTPEVLSLMPDDDSGMTFRDRFVGRNYWKEIGAETEEIFEYNLENKAREVVNRYKWKIDQYLENRETLLDKFVTLTEKEETQEGKEETHENSGSTSETRNQTTTQTGTQTTDDDTTVTHEGYFNPVTKTDPNLNALNKDITDGTQTLTNDLTDTVGGSTEGESADSGTSSYTLKNNRSRTHDELYRAFKSMPEMIELTNKIEVLYETALREMDVLFMGIL